MSGAEPKMP
ncbi:hypothetical protein D030_3052A, partial [Vibrio parahaemolyticus AQ3810]